MANRDRLITSFQPPLVSVPDQTLSLDLALRFLLRGCGTQTNANGHIDLSAAACGWALFRVHVRLRSSIQRVLAIHILTYFTDYCIIPNSIGFYIGSLCKSSDVRKLFLGRCHVHAAITVAPPLLGLGL